MIHPSSVPVSREHRRAKTDRLDTELLKRGFLMKRPTSTLESGRNLLEQGAKALLARETLSVTDLQDLVSSTPTKTPLREDAVAAQ